MIETTLAALADRFETFLVDQFGVLLDGGGAYPGASAALAALTRQGKRVLVLSNSGKRAAANARRLAGMGFAPETYHGVMSSGEAAFGVLSGRIGADLPSGARVLLLARDGDLSAIAGLDLVTTDAPQAADLVILAGSRGEVVTLDQYRELLTDPAARRVPCLCTNPDMTMLTGQGPFFGAGRIAELYQTLGGTVDFVGKPHPLIYRVALERLGVTDPANVVCIGDSPAHDIRGGRAAGLATALVRTGIHAQESLEDILTSDADRPDFVLSHFAF